MALAEARAAWQRTANRCLVQEDAKRAPKLACCSSLPTSVKHTEMGPTNASGAQDIPGSGSAPFDRNPPYSNLSPSSRWWLQLQPNYGYQKTLMDEHLHSLDTNKETGQIQEKVGDLVRKKDDFVTCENKDYTVKEEKFRSLYNMDCEDPLKIEVKEYFHELRDEGGLVGCQVSKDANDQYFYSESSWIGAEKNTPWWRTADTEELAILVAQRSCDLIDNCDLPRPQNTRLEKDRSMNTCYFSHDQISTTLAVRKSGIGNDHTLASRSSSHKLSVTTEDQLVSGASKPLRDWTILKRMNEMHKVEDDDDSSKAKLLEALRHSQTRAREAEEVAKQACAEKEHVVKLVIRQASQLFAYKQWLQLLQLENMYFQFKQSTYPVNLPHPRSATLRTRKMRGRKRAKRSRPWYDVGKYAIVFALGLGLVGAGLLLGWSIGWMLPTW